MRMDRFLLSIVAFVLLVVTIVFFRDNNMYWWPFMFAFIITAGFLANSVDYPEAICRHGKIVINSGRSFNEDEAEECPECDARMEEIMAPIMNNIMKHKSPKWQITSEELSDLSGTLPYKYQDKWQVPNSWYEEREAVNNYEDGKEAIKRYDADIKYRPDVTDEVREDDDEIIF